jgi:hypothetical protein
VLCLLIRPWSSPYDLEISLRSSVAIERYIAFGVATYLTGTNICFNYKDRSIYVGQGTDAV